MSTNPLGEFYPELDLESESVDQSSYFLTRLASVWGEDFLEPDGEERENPEVSQGFYAGMKCLLPDFCKKSIA
jgi:hypothetical protein